MDLFEPIVKMIGTWPLALQVASLLFGTGIAWRFLEYKVIQPKANQKVNGIHEVKARIEEVEKKVDDVNLEVSNHLTTEVRAIQTMIEKKFITVKSLDTSIQNLITTVSNLNDTVRNLTEQTNRNVSTMNVVLSKQDDLMKEVIRIQTTRAKL